MSPKEKNQTSGSSGGSAGSWFDELLATLPLLAFPYLY